MKKNAATALLLILLLTGQGSAEVLPSESYSPQKITGFISFLVQKKEYYRATLELKRYYHFYPELSHPSSLAVTEEFLLLQGKQYKEVFKVPAYYNSFPGPADRIFHADSLLLSGKYVEGIKLLNGVEDEHDRLFSGIIERRRIFTAIMLGISGSREDFFKLEKSPLPDSYSSVMKHGREFISSYKNPYLGASLGIIPGLGYLYAGKTGTGILTFVMVSLCSSLSYLAFRYNTDSAGIFLGAIATFFYTGSIVGGYSMSKKYNTSQGNLAKDQIYRELNIQNDQRFLLRKYGLKGI